VLSLLSRHLPLALSQIDVAQSLRALRQKCQWPPTTELSVEVPAYGSTSRTWYGRPISYVVQERPNYQQASNMGAGGTGGAGGAGGVSYASGAASEANKHHARHTSNENLRPAQQYTGPRRQTGSYARYSGAHSGGGSGGS
jgi:hypothetical protein